LRVVGQQAHLFDAQVRQDLGANPIVSKIGGKTKVSVGVDCIETLVLEFIGFEFVQDADAAPFLSKIEQDSAFFGNLFKGGFQLWAAIASSGVKDVTS
jgi:hypothetical protein